MTRYLIEPRTSYTTLNSTSCNYNAGGSTQVSGNSILFKGDATTAGSWRSAYTRQGFTLSKGCTYTLSVPWAATGSYGGDISLTVGFMSALPQWQTVDLSPPWANAGTGTSNIAVRSTAGSNASGTAEVTFRPSSTGTFYLGYIARYLQLAGTTTACSGYIKRHCGGISDHRSGVSFTPAKVKDFQSEVVELSAARDS